MGDRTISRADAKLIAEAASDCADRALGWKDRALAAEALVARFVAWVDRADAPNDDAQYLNGEHPEQRAMDRNGWDDIRDLANLGRTFPLAPTYGGIALSEHAQSGAYGWHPGDDA